MRTEFFIGFGVKGYHENRLDANLTAWFFIRVYFFSRGKGVSKGLWRVYFMIHDTTGLIETLQHFLRSYEICERNVILIPLFYCVCILTLFHLTKKHVIQGERFSEAQCNSVMCQQSLDMSVVILFPVIGEMCIVVICPIVHYTAIVGRERTMPHHLAQRFVVQDIRRIIDIFEHMSVHVVLPIVNTFAPVHVEMIVLVSLPVINEFAVGSPLLSNLVMLVRRSTREVPSCFIGFLGGSHG